MSNLSHKRLQHGIFGIGCVLLGLIILRMQTVTDQNLLVLCAQAMILATVPVVIGLIPIRIFTLNELAHIMPTKWIYGQGHRALLAFMGMVLALPVPTFASTMDQGIGLLIQQHRALPLLLFYSAIAALFGAWYVDRRVQEQRKPKLLS